mmetsp:Transcript_5672/g.10154  ORF Transcript_5672/g.10154 Transcript_5672/m.10154 type:complete len:291 (+) Transcript_5672:81-953(+)
MGTVSRLFWLALPVLILACFCVPDPKLLLGEFLGRHVQIAREASEILFFLFVVRPVSIHPQLAALEHVMARMDDKSLSDVSRLDEVLSLVDDYGWNHGFLINVGDVKGKILDEAVRQRIRNGPGQPRVVVELGTHLGYGTLRLARVLNQSDTEIITVDPDTFAYAVSSSLYEQANVRDRITIKKDYSYNVFEELKKHGKKIDVLFVDHVKSLYLSDLKLALQLDLLAPGCVVVGDNIRSPGAPDFKQYLLEGEGKELFTTEVHATHVEYWPLFPDEVTVSTFLGGQKLEV